MKTIEPTHWIPYDAPKVGKTTKRAICGALTEKHSNLPTCHECLDYLARNERETVEERFG